MSKQAMVVGVAGAGRALELHYGGYERVHGVEVRLKTVAARRAEQLEAAKARYGFEKTSTRFEDLLEDPEINVIDICTPPYAHADMIIAALRAGKDVICEKPLIGCFDPELSKAQMYDFVCAKLDEIEAAERESGKRIMYAENFVYAPSVQKAIEFVNLRGSRILCIEGQCTINGSTSPVAGEWAKTGGGTFIRNGIHPLSGALWLKAAEGAARGEEIVPVSVSADMGRTSAKLDADQKRSMFTTARNVEDCGTATFTFSDGSKAVIMAKDICLGGSLNYMKLFCNDGRINCNMTPNNLIETYFPDDRGIEKYPFAEMLPFKTGWNNPFVSDETERGYLGEIQDFAECVATGRVPKAGFALAKTTMKALYAAYMSDEKGCRVMI